MESFSFSHQFHVDMAESAHAVILAILAETAGSVHYNWSLPLPTVLLSSTALSAQLINQVDRQSKRQAHRPVILKAICPQVLHLNFSTPTCKTKISIIFLSVPLTSSVCQSAAGQKYSKSLEEFLMSRIVGSILHQFIGGGRMLKRSSRAFCGASGLSHLCFLIKKHWR